MDISDYLFKTMLNAVTWIIGGIMKLVANIISGLFRIIFGLFKNGDDSDA